MSLLTVGTVAFDTIETPHGVAEMVLGGSGTFSAFAASYFTQPRLVGVVGADFPAKNRTLLQQRGIDTDGIATEANGKTFFWHGRYHTDMNHRDTIEVQLNVIAHFNPTLPAHYRNSTHIFLANGHPATQARVLDQIDKPQLVLADTMDLWITTEHEALVKLLPRVDGLLLNDSEAKQLTGEASMVKAGAKIRSMGPKFVIIKRGEFGAMLVTSDNVSVIPAFPTDAVVDPTGAGDSFAGGVLGYLSTSEGVSVGSMRRAMAYGTVIASLTVEGFGLERLQSADRTEIDARLEQYRAMLHF